MNTTNDKTDSRDNGELVDRVIRDAGSIGKVWAKYGLHAGRAALDATATTLHKTASLLGDIATRFESQEGKSEAVNADAPAEPSAPEKPSNVA